MSAHSSDLNPTEDVWGILVTNIYNRNFRLQKEIDLWSTIEDSWEESSKYEKFLPKFSLFYAS